MTQYKFPFIIAAALALSGCKKEQPQVIKLDYTSTYESAAYALVSAKENYNKALQGNDSQSIAVAKKKLDYAQSMYDDSKNTFVKQGGKPVSNIEALPPKPQPQASQAAPQEKAVQTNPAPAVVTKPAVLPPPITPVTNAKKEITAAEKKTLRKLRQDSINKKIKKDMDALNARTQANLKRSNDSARARLNRIGNQFRKAFKIK